MSSVSVNISNVIDSLLSSEIPAKFSDDRMVLVFNTINYESNKKLYKYIIKIQLEDLIMTQLIPIKEEYLTNIKLEHHRAIIISESGQINGKIRDVQPTFVDNGKNIGKKNETNCLTQAIRDALSKYNKYNKKSNEISNNIIIEPVLYPPMLASKLNDRKLTTLTQNDFDLGITAQKKLNGVHLVAFNNGKEVVMYSRNCNIYKGCSSIKKELFEMTSIWNKITNTNQIRYFAGELYLHGKPLNWISGQARKDIDEDLLEYHIFDTFMDTNGNIGYTSLDRQKFLDEFFKYKIDKFPHLIRVENYKVISMDNAKQLCSKFISENYEGCILRKDNGLYTYSINGYHSTDLIKLKLKHDSEFQVMEMTQGIKGKDVGAIVWICQVPKESPNYNPKDNLFNVVPSGMTYEQRYKLYKYLNEKIEDNITRFDKEIKGLLMTIEYPELSNKTGKPLQAKAIGFRTYEADNDPIKLIFNKLEIFP